MSRHVAQRPGGPKGARPKSGPAKQYADAEIVHFAEFREQRQPMAPTECDHGGLCWVAVGPPAISPSGHCLGCNGLPKAFGDLRQSAVRAMMIDLEAEYLAALSDTSPLRRRELLQAGVPQHAIDLAGPAYARVRPVGRLLFEPNPDSELGAFILPVRADYPDTPESTDPEAAIADGDILDLVAFDPELGAQWILRTGNAEWLGACLPQYLDPPPVALHRSPIDWLRASCDGLVCLATRPTEIYRFLVRFAALDVADHGHAEALQELLERPPSNPEILVGGRARHVG